jgi:hypothetical protein
MARRLDADSREILEFRPDIEFVEPPIGPGVITAAPPAASVEEVEAAVDRVTKLAQAVNALAAATQAKADIRAQDMVIRLDPAADARTIAAMKRVYPGADPFQITYDQYRHCKDNQRLKGEDIARKALISPEEIGDARKTVRAEQNRGNIRGATSTAGYGTEAARTGGLRPELNPRINMLEPLDIEEFQDVLIRILVNFIWANFIKPSIQTAAAASLVGGPVAGIIEAVPDEIAPLPEGFKVGDIIDKGTPILGEKPPKFMTDVPEVPTSLDSAQAQQDQEKEQ